MSWGTATLRAEQQWLPVHLLGLDRATWPLSPSTHVAAIGSVADWVAHAPGKVHEGSPIVAPSDVSATTGAPASRPARRDSPAWRLGPGGLREGDLLVPLASNPLALLIREDYVGLAFAPTFVLVRPNRDVVLPEVLWAILNSVSGRAARATLSASASVPRSADLLDFEVPIPTSGEQQRIATAVVQLRIGAAPTEAAVRESWWKTASLVHEQNWSYVLSGKVPVDLNAGTPLGEIAEIFRGKKRLETADRPGPDLLPVLRHRDLLRGWPPALWAAPTEPIARSGDVVFSDMQSATPAVKIDAEYAVDAHLFVIRAHLASDRDRIAQSLNSERGRAARAALSAGTTVAMLTMSNARRLPIANDPTQVQPGPADPLPVTLERLIWP